jgi:hypothetical protein
LQKKQVQITLAVVAFDMPKPVSSRDSLPVSRAGIDLYVDS